MSYKPARILSGFYAETRRSNAGKSQRIALTSSMDHGRSLLSGYVLIPGAFRVPRAQFRALRVRRAGEGKPNDPIDRI